MDDKETLGIEYVEMKEFVEAYRFLSNIGQAIEILTRYLRKKDSNFDVVIQQIHQERKKSKH